MTSRGKTPGYRRRLHRFATLAAAGVVVTAATVFALAGVAHAASSTTCQGTSSITYSPGLTFTPQTVDYTETDTFSSCVSTDPTLASGIATAGGEAVPLVSCLGLPGVITDPAYTITWNNGQHSVVELTYTDVIVGGTEQVTGTGPVLSGQFQGGNATIVWLYPVLNPLQCLTSPGVTNISGPFTAQITTL